MEIYMHNKLPIDDNLMLRGCNLPSTCNFCLKSSVTSNHILFECSYAYHIWNWLSSIIHVPIISSAIINIVCAISYARNQIRFNNTSIHWKSSIVNIISNMALSGNSTSKCSNNSISDFAVLKAFDLKILPPKAPPIREVLWQPAIQDWIKCNSDGASSRMLGRTACGGMFRQI